MTKQVHVAGVSIPRLLAFYELIKLASKVKGSFVELGVGSGGSFNTMIQISRILEPYNWSRRFIGFDSFEGFPAVGERDHNPIATAKEGECNFAATPEEIYAASGADGIPTFTKDGPRVELVKGDILHTVPRYIEGHGEAPPHKHLLVALLHLDCDLYEPTLCGLQHFVPRMPKGAVIVFDEVDMYRWPGETEALLETFDINQLELRQFPYQGQLSYAVL